MKKRKSVLRKRYGRAARVGPLPTQAGRRRSRRHVAHITGAWITHYGDNGQVKAYVRWQNDFGEEGTTEGDPNNLHMQALLDRAIRSGIRIKHSSSGAIYDPAILEPGERFRVAPPLSTIPARFM
jgi:hypothetical protein